MSNIFIDVDIEVVKLVFSIIRSTERNFKREAINDIEFFPKSDLY